MTRHGPTSCVEGRYVELQAAVLRALPRDIPLDIALNWARNGKFLSQVLHDALAVRHRRNDTAFPVSVDYTLTPDEAIRNGRYDVSSTEEITSRYFSKAHRQHDLIGKKHVVIELINLFDEKSHRRVLEKINILGYRPANIRELLAFGETYPEVQRQYRILALDSVWQIEIGYTRFAPCLHSFTTGERILEDTTLDTWPDTLWLAVVRQSS